MSIFERLESALHSAREEQELPDHLAREVELILRQREIFHGRTQEIEELIHMLEVYDTYAQTGYIGMGVDSAILQGALKKMLYSRGFRIASGDRAMVPGVRVSGSG